MAKPTKESNDYLDGFIKRCHSEIKLAREARYEIVREGALERIAEDARRTLEHVKKAKGIIASDTPIKTHVIEDHSGSHQGGQ
jgi:hypothetical protein